MKLLALILAAALASGALAANLDGRKLQVVDGRLVDSRGREVTLRGVNARVNGVFDVTFDDGRLPLEDVPTFDAGDVDRMREHGILYERVGESEYFHAYTRMFADRFFFEVVQRKGDYDGYGALNAPARMASEAGQPGTPPL